IHAQEICAVRRAEEKAAPTIKRDVREAFGERPRADELERAGTWIDAVAVCLVRLGAHRGNEKALVRAYGHWHDELFRLEPRSRLQPTVRLQRIHPDIAVLGVGDVDECGRERGDARDHGEQDRNDGYLHRGSSCECSRSIVSRSVFERVFYLIVTVRCRGAPGVRLAAKTNTPHCE